MNFEQQAITFKDIKTPPIQDGEYLIAGFYINQTKNRFVTSASYDVDLNEWDTGVCAVPDIEILCWSEMPFFPVLV